MDIIKESKNIKPKKYKVTFLPEGKEVFISSKETVLDGANKLNIPLIADCGGMGLCGKCKVKLLKGSVSSEDLIILPEKEAKEGYILSCQSYPTSDLILEVPSFSVVTGVKKSKNIHDNFSHLEKLPYSYSPTVIKTEIPFPENFEEGNSLLDIIEMNVNKKLHTSKLSLSTKTLLNMQNTLKTSQREIDVIVGKDGSVGKIISVREKSSKEGIYGVVFDIGTTMLESVLIELSTGSVIRYTSSLNPQIKYGRDLSTRLGKSIKDEKLFRLLNDLLVDEINEILFKLTYESKISHKNVYSVLLSGNTAMIHFLLGLDPRGILRGLPVALRYPQFKASDVSLYAHPEALVYITPCVGRYVGGDIVSAILSTGLKEEEFLLVDMGTNGEVAYFMNGTLICASTSAGPAFEGGGIRDGMPSTKGAIHRVYFSQTHNDFKFKTIDGAPPTGISGAGIIDLISTLFIEGFIDKKGKFKNINKTNRIKKIDGEKRFILAETKDKAISISENEIEYIIHTKGALYTGYTFLLEKIGKKIEDVSTFYISGTLGNMINIKNAITIGLLPDIPVEKFKFLGNGSLKGGIMLLLSKEARDKATEVSKSSVYFDLSNEPEYMANYTSSLFLPHTHLHLFPNVKIHNQ